MKKRGIKKSVNGKFSKEVLLHFNCGTCTRWWCVADAYPAHTMWYCTWCGALQDSLKDVSPKELL